MRIDVERAASRAVERLRAASAFDPTPGEVEREMIRLARTVARACARVADAGEPSGQRTYKWTPPYTQARHDAATAIRAALRQRKAPKRRKG